MSLKLKELMDNFLNTICSSCHDDHQCTCIYFDHFIELLCINDDQKIIQTANIINKMLKLRQGELVHAQNRISPVFVLYYNAGFIYIYIFIHISI
jgi:hypothetical protein